jgi:hypothetical protein
MSPAFMIFSVTQIPLFLKENYPFELPNAKKIPFIKNNERD